MSSLQAKRRGGEGENEKENEEEGRTVEEKRGKEEGAKTIMWKRPSDPFGSS